MTYRQAMKLVPGQIVVYKPTGKQFKVVKITTVGCDTVVITGNDGQEYHHRTIREKV